MIKYSSTNGMQNSQAQHQFSLIPKSIRRTLERIQLPEAIINKSEKLKVTITFESKELVMEFNRPVYSKEGPTPLEKGSEDSYGPVLAKKASEKLIMQHQKSSRSLRPSFSTILNKGDEIDEQNLSNLNLNMEFNKVRMCGIAGQPLREDVLPEQALQAPEEVFLHVEEPHWNRTRLEWPEAKGVYGVRLVWQVVDGQARDF